MLNVRVSAPTAQRVSVASPGPLSGCRGRSRTALTSCRPQRTLNPQRQINDNCPLRHSPNHCYIVRIRSSRAGSVIPAKAGIQRARQWSAHGAGGAGASPRRSRADGNLASLLPVPIPNPQINDNCPLRHSPNHCYIVRIRSSRAGSVIPAKAGIQRARQWSAHGAGGAGASPRRSRADGNLASLLPVPIPNPQINDNCPLRHSPAGCYIVHIRYARVGSDVPAKARNLASPVPCMIPSPSGRVRVRVRGIGNATKCNQMQPK